MEDEGKVLRPQDIADEFFSRFLLDCQDPFLAWAGINEQSQRQAQGNKRAERVSDRAGRRGRKAFRGLHTHTAFLRCKIETRGRDFSASPTRHAIFSPSVSLRLPPAAGSTRFESASRDPECAGLPATRPSLRPNADADVATGPVFTFFSSALRLTFLLTSENAVTIHETEDALRQESGGTFGNFGGE